jgi:uncharacterized OB-fold protein
MAAFCACCGAEIGPKAEACPACGAPQHGTLQRKGNGVVATVEAGYPPVREDKASDAEAAGQKFHSGGGCCRI